MKKYIFKTLALACICLGLASCNEKLGDGIKLKGIEVGSNGSISLLLGKTAYVPAYPIPWDCTDYEFSYSSSNESVVTVDAYGFLVSQDAGDAVITVSCGNYTNTLNVNVYEVPVEQTNKLKTISGLTGLWEFKGNKPMRATVGSDLIAYYHSSDNQLGTTDGASTHYKIVNGFNEYDGAIETDYGLLFWAEHGIPVDDATGLVLEYTFVIDCKMLSASYNKWKSWFVCRTLQNNQDQDIMPNKTNQIRFGGGDYCTGNAMENDVWYRVALVRTATSSAVYVDGVLWDEWNSADSRTRLQPNATLFMADNDGDDAPQQISNFAIYNRALSASEVASLGNLK